MSLLAKLPPHHAAPVRRLGETFHEARHRLHLVGGVVRDLLLERALPNDLDFATSAVPEQTRELGLAAGARSTYDIGEKFGTIGLVFPGAEGDEDAPVVVEVTTYRAEHYPDESRYPTVAFGASLADDLARRDFTINAMALDATTGELVDPFDGLLDLHQARLRAVGQPDERFAEDPLRLLRAARFVAQLGFFIEHETAAAMARRAPELGRISQERIFAELTKLLCGRWASHGLEALLDTGLLVQAMPELEPLAAEATVERGIMHREKDLWEHTLRVVDKAPARPAVRWAALLHDAAKPQTRSIGPSGEVHFFAHERVGAELAERILLRLKADKALRTTVARLVELHLRPASYDRDWTDSAVRRLMLEADGVLEELLDLVAADITSANPRKQQAARDRMAALRAHIARLEAEHALSELKSPLDGDELMAMFDRPPGRWIAEVKDHLRELVIDGQLAPDDKTAAAEIARRLLAS
jgi:poly(A) polymerase